MNSDIKAPLPWQQNQWQRLLDNFQQNRLAHALLLRGPTGLGKQLFATALGHNLLCKQTSIQGACGSCKSCQLLAAGNHPDFHLVSLEEKAQAIKIDQIRELVVALSKTPQIARRHCVLIEPADCLNTNAANALLKLLEEPQGDAVIILISAYPQRLPATIRSRCQQTVFTIPSRTDALTWLQQFVTNDGDAYLQLANGAPLLAKQLAQEQGLEAYQELSNLLENTLLDQSILIDTAATFAARPGSQVVDTMLDWLRVIVLHRLMPVPPQSDLVNFDLVGFDLVDKELGPMLTQLSKDGNPLAIYRFYDKLIAIKGLLISSANPNKNLLWEECLMDWAALMKTVS